MSNERFASVWDAIEDTPEAAENMKLRSVLLTALKNHLTRTEMSQTQADSAAVGRNQKEVSPPIPPDLICEDNILNPT
jgi:predicted XRE-type DNA-binding protein